MTLQDTWEQEIPADTAELGDHIMAAEDPYRLVGEGINACMSTADFRDLYSRIGRGALCPLILALVTVFQFLERLPDRAAAEWAVKRIDWKYALHVPLGWRGFHFSSLSNFRQRLLEHEAERLVFEKVLEWVQGRGLLKKHGRQRSDSTHVLGCVEQLTRLELAWETVRVTLQALRKRMPTWYAQQIPGTLHNTYEQRRSEWRLSESEVRGEMQQVGQDGFWLLRCLAAAPAAVQELSEVHTLRTVWEQQFKWEAESQQVTVRRPGGRGQGKEMVVTPHDPEVRWSKKRSTEWRGYKVHVTETAEAENAVQFLTDIEVTAANDYDSESVDALQQRLAERSLLPQEHYVDQGYTSGANLAHSAARGTELVGPVAGDTAGKPEGYRQSDFTLDFATQQATCPQGHVAPKWYPRPQEDRAVGAEIQFRERCTGCPVRAECAPGKSGRTLRVNPYHHELRQRRAEQDTPAFKTRMHRRAAVEGTISELTRTHGARRARYRGLAKVRLQMLFTGAAVNLKRMARALATQKQRPAGVTSDA